MKIDCYKEKKILKESSILAHRFTRLLEQKTFSLFVTIYMFKKAINNEQLAALSGCSIMAINHYVSGDRAPGITISSSIFDALGVTSKDYLIFKKTVNSLTDIA